MRCSWNARTFDALLTLFYKVMTMTQVRLHRLSGVAYAATPDWSRPLRETRMLVLPAAFTSIAFAALYRLEHRP